MVNLHFQKGNGNSTLTKGNFCPANGEYLRGLCRSLIECCIFAKNLFNMELIIKKIKDLFEIFKYFCGFKIISKWK